MTIGLGFIYLRVEGLGFENLGFETIYLMVQGLGFREESKFLRPTWVLNLNTSLKPCIAKTLHLGRLESRLGYHVALC